MVLCRFRHKLTNFSVCPQSCDLISLRIYVDYMSGCTFLSFGTNNGAYCKCSSLSFRTNDRAFSKYSLSSFWTGHRCTVLKLDYRFVDTVLKAIIRQIFQSITLSSGQPLATIWNSGIYIIVNTVNVRDFGILLPGPFRHVLFHIFVALHLSYASGGSSA